MELNIMILNTMRYEKDGKQKSRLGYIMTNSEANADNEKFKGFSELAHYRDDDKLFTTIPREFIGQKCTCKIDEIPSKSNPMKSYKLISEITCNGKTIYLV